MQIGILLEQWSKYFSDQVKKYQQKKITIFKIGSTLFSEASTKVLNILGILFKLSEAFISTTEKLPEAFTSVLNILHFF